MTDAVVENPGPPSRFFEQLRDPEAVALGALALSMAPELVDIAGSAGLDYVVIDHQLVPLGWAETAVLIRAANGVGLTPLIRTASNPWATHRHGDDPAYLMRTVAFGAAGILPSVRTTAEVEVILDATREWKRSIWVMELDDESARFRNRFPISRPIVMPLLEDIATYDNVGEMMALPGVDYLMIACTDIVKQMGHPLEYDHPDLWKVIDDVVALGREHGVTVGANTGLKPTTIAGQAERVRQLREHGVRVVLLQTHEFVFQLALRELVHGAR